MYFHHKKQNKILGFIKAKACNKYVCIMKCLYLCLLLFRHATTMYYTEPFLLKFGIWKDKLSIPKVSVIPVRLVKTEIHAGTKAN